MFYNIVNWYSDSILLLHPSDMMEININYFTDINECLSSPCQHGSSCVDDINSYTCICVDGYTGAICETGMYSNLTQQFTPQHKTKMSNSIADMFR